MDCCSLEGRTLKDGKVVEVLTDFVLVRLEPLKWDEDAAFGKRFGIENYPALLALDWKGEKKLAAVGDEPPGKVAETLRAALEH